MDFQDPLFTTLMRAADRLREARVPGSVTQALDRLAGQVEQPCVIAVVGRVKAGKSSFVNALLGEDLAKVGATETTATINYFTYGPSDPVNPIQCHWKGGQITNEPRAFLDELQGNDEATLRRANGIDYLEYQLPNPYLRQVTLVDTPGLAAVVDEHQDRLAAFMGLEAQMRTRNLKETERLNAEADAVIYVMGQVARSSDQAFLEEFAQSGQTGARAINAIGVITRIDLQPEIMQRRDILAARIAVQLQDSLNTVIPVSAGIQRTLDGLLADDAVLLDRLENVLNRIPPPRLEMLLDSEEFFRDFDFADCPVSPQERADALGEMSWTVFTTIARSLAKYADDPLRAVEELRNVAGFRPLKQALEKRFFERSHLLRRFRIAADARRLLEEVRYRSLPAMRRQDAESNMQIARFVHFVESAPGELSTKREMIEFFTIQQSIRSQSEHLAVILQDVDRDLAHVFHELEESHSDFEALQVLDDHTQDFSPAERDELQALFGKFGVAIESRLTEAQLHVEWIEQQARVWTATARNSHGSARRQVSEFAVTRYQSLLDQILK